MLEEIIKQAMELASMSPRVRKILNRSRKSLRNPKIKELQPIRVHSPRGPKTPLWHLEDVPAWGTQ